MTASLAEFMRFWARRQPDQLAFHCDGHELSWSEIDRRTDAVAAGLYAAGVRPGDRVGILMRNRLEFVETMFGAFKAGATLVLLNVRYTAAEMIHPIIDTRPSMVVADEALMPALAKGAEQVPAMRIYATDPLAGHRSLADLRGSDAAPPPLDVAENDVALICYTSGTTGVPKGALLTHAGIYEASIAKSVAVGQTYRDRQLLAMPLAFTGGAIMLIREGIIPGATTYLMPSADPDAMLDTLQRHRITSTGGVPILFERMMAHSDFGNADLSSLRHVATGGAVITHHLIQTWQARGVQLNQGYGQTETSGSFVAILFPEEARDRLGFAGRRLPHATLRIVGEDGRIAPPGQPGEIQVRSGAVMKGYLNLPELSAQALADGWLRTGDAGFMDEQGYLKIVDRVKDLLISGGLNVYPAEIEKTLSGVAGLNEFAVIGVSDARWGEIPIIVAPDANGVDLAALRHRCRSELADYKRPRFLVAHGEALPRTFSGKIQKPALRTAYPAPPPHAIDLKE